MTIAMPKLVIFDCDGVLIDSELIACRVEIEILSDIGHPITFEDFRDRFVGTSRASSLAALESDWGRALPLDYGERVRTRLEEAFRRELKPIDGMPELVALLGERCAVASSSSLARLALTLGLTGFTPLFGNRVFSAEQVTRGKPSPDLFLLAAQMCGTDPTACLVVEDSRFGIAAAKAAGMAAMGFTGGSHCVADYAATLIGHGADAVADNTGDLVRWINLGAP